MLKLLPGTVAWSVASILAAQSAWAQNSDASASNQVEEIETVSVSASRISIAGYDQPTPVTVLGAAELQRDAKVDVADAIRQLPSFGLSSSPQNSQNANLVTTGTEGLNLINLRNLGVNRTLVLFDGQRVVASSVAGGVDLNTIPTALVQRVDVVTGGASAAWGSDAVAGVVNILIDKKFSGVAFNITDSDNWGNEHEQRKAELSLGTDFAGGRGHVILSGTFQQAPDEYYARQTEGFKYQRLVPNPNAGPGQPALIQADYVSLAQATRGGVITGPAPTLLAPNPLIGTYFTGPNATPGVFDFGNKLDGYYSAGGTQDTNEGDYQLQAFPTKSTTVFGLASFDVTDNVKASLQLNYGDFSALSNSYSDVRYGNLKIMADNPYIPAAVQQEMQAAGMPFFNLGTLSTGDLSRTAGLAEQAQSLGMPVIQQYRNLYRGVFSLDGKLGDNWSWNAYYQHGESRFELRGVNNQQNSRYNLAVDAVRVTPANVGTSGLPLGSIVCRSTLTNPANGCAPLDVFGEGNYSQAAIAYINGVARAGGEHLIGILKEDVGAGSMQGTLPFGFSAGSVSTAFGLEYRRELGVQTAAPANQASTFQLGNPHNFYGKYDTKEAFLEFNVPVLKDQGVKSLGFDLAGRLTDYSTSGTVETYKVGLTSQIVDALKFRGSYSFDIRAPDLTELFNAGTPVTGAAVDPRTGNSVSVFDTTEGNPNLKPEESTTVSFGFVVTPFAGFSTSIDYYNIDIKKAISSFSSQTILQQCAAGNQLFCDDLVFGGPNGELSAILVAPLNSDSETTSGLDYAADYRTPFLAGALDINLVANYVFEQTQTSLGESYDFAGGISSDSPYDGAPKFRGQVAVTYAQGGWTGTVQSRVIGKTHLVTSWTSGVDVDNNDIAPVYYLDLRGAYKFDNGVQVYGAIDNFLDRAPPLVPPSQGASSGFESPFKDEFYDGFGRVWRLGVRAKF